MKRRQIRRTLDRYGPIALVLLVAAAAIAGVIYLALEAAAGIQEALVWP